MRIRYTKLALAHFQELKRTSTEQFGASVARATVAKVHQSIEDLTRFPERGRAGRIAGTRELIITGTPFIVAYHLDHDEVQVLAILHGARAWPSFLR